MIFKWWPKVKVKKLLVFIQMFFTKYLKTILLDSYLILCRCCPRRWMIGNKFQFMWSKVKVRVDVHIKYFISSPELKAANFDLSLALTTIEQWGFVCVTWDIRLYGHLWGLVTHTSVAEPLAVELSGFVLMTYVYCDCGFNPYLPLARQINTLPTEILLPNENYLTALLLIGFYLKPMKIYLFSMIFLF